MEEYINVFSEGVKSSGKYIAYNEKYGSIMMYLFLILCVLLLLLYTIYNYSYYSNILQQPLDYETQPLDYETQPLDYETQPLDYEIEDYDIDKLKKEAVIPLHIYQTWHTKDLPPKMYECVEKLKKANPEFTHHLYDDVECREFIKNNFEQDVLDAYDNLIPGAYKADLWRYCILYINGGIYLDIKFEPINGFKFISCVDKEHFPCERPYIDKNMQFKDEKKLIKQPNYYDIVYDKIDKRFWKDKKLGIQFALMITKPNNQILHDCIQQVVYNVKNKEYGYNALYPTGPGLIGEKYFKGDMSKIKDIDIFLSIFGEYFITKNKPILKIYDEYRAEQNMHQNTEYYSVLWHKKQIYQGEAIIPLHIYQTWHTKNLPPKMYECVEKLKKANPEFTHHLYDLNDCREFIETNFGEEVVDAYDNLIPTSYKSDLWRCCVLYINGGIYLDIKYEPVNGFKFIDIIDKEHFALDQAYSNRNIKIEDELKLINHPNYYDIVYDKIRLDNWKDKNIGIACALLIVKPKNPILLECIQQIVHNVKNKVYGHTCLYPTGPGLIGEVYFKGDMSKIKDMDIFYSQVGTYFITRNKVILKIYEQYREEQKIHQNTEHYGVLWHKKQIYKEPPTIMQKIEMFLQNIFIM
jgi:mannosyltransferase OCH1-like enzyme